MSLLLDALKRTDAGHPSSNTGTRLSAREYDGETPAHLPSGNSIPASRAAGSNLFAAKSTPAGARFHLDLGLVPTALIIGSALAAAGSIYVWHEIEPPQAATHRPPPQVQAPAASLAPRPQLQPEAPQPLAEELPQVAEQAPRSETRERHWTRRRPMARQRAAAGISIEHQTEIDTVDPTLAAAYQAYRNGDFGTAWQRYREVLQKDARNRDALLGMAAIAQQQGQDEVAAQYYRLVLEQDPRDPLANAGMEALTGGDAAGKESRLKRLLAQNPQSATLRFALGNIYSEQSRWGAAQQAYFDALGLEPANAQFAFNLAASLDHLGQSRLAAQYYRQALQLDTSGNSGFDRAAVERRLSALNTASHDREKPR